MRVGVISLYHESNTFMPRPTTLADFERYYVLTGQAVRERFTNQHHEVAGFWRGLEEAGAKVEAVPVFLAWTIPSGTITNDALQALLTRMFTALDKAGKLDGILVAPHGAAVSEKIRDVDGHWLTQLRQRVGRQMPILGTLDPHVNLSPAMVDATDGLVAYRSNPHLDQFQRGQEAARLMVRTLNGGI